MKFKNILEEYHTLNDYIQEINNEMNKENVSNIIKMVFQEKLKELNKKLEVFINTEYITIDEHQSKLRDAELDDMKRSNFDLCIFANKGYENEILEGYDTYEECLARMDDFTIDDTKEHFTILEYKENSEEVLKETRLNSKKLPYVEV